ncbi:MAG: hypothetical protein OWQ57_10500 [Sulfobacillus sp.]|nr:hypothetical protein [Sulfobacillus sp.]
MNRFRQQWNALSFDRKLTALLMATAALMMAFSQVVEVSLAVHRILWVVSAGCVVGAAVLSTRPGRMPSSK